MYYRCDSTSKGDYGNDDTRSRLSYDEITTYDLVHVPPDNSSAHPDIMLCESKYNMLNIIIIYNFFFADSNPTYEFEMTTINTQDSLG